MARGLLCDYANGKKLLQDRISELEQQTDNERQERRGNRLRFLLHPFSEIRRQNELPNLRETQQIYDEALAQDRTVLVGTYGEERISTIDEAIDDLFEQVVDNPNSAYNRYPYRRGIFPEAQDWMLKWVDRLAKVGKRESPQQT